MPLEPVSLIPKCPVIHVFFFNLKPTPSPFCYLLSLIRKQKRNAFPCSCCYLDGIYERMVLPVKAAEAKPPSASSQPRRQGEQILPSLYPPFRLMDVSLDSDDPQSFSAAHCARLAWKPASLDFPSPTRARRPPLCAQALSPPRAAQLNWGPHARDQFHSQRRPGRPETELRSAAAAEANSTAGSRQGPSRGTSGWPSPWRWFLSGQSYSRCILLIAAGTRPLPPAPRPRRRKRSSPSQHPGTLSPSA